jgi:hypothetical protein
MNKRKPVNIPLDGFADLIVLYTFVYYSYILFTIGSQKDNSTVFLFEGFQY